MSREIKIFKTTEVKIAKLYGYGHEQAFVPGNLRDLIKQLIKKVLSNLVLKFADYVAFAAVLARLRYCFL